MFPNTVRNEAMLCVIKYIFKHIPIQWEKQYINYFNVNSLQYNILYCILAYIFTLFYYLHEAAKS